jgi:hypothetical protein
MKNRYLKLILIVGTLLFSCQPKQETVYYLTNNGFGNSVYGNSGEFFKGVTYVAYQGPGEDPYVAAYDHAREKWIGLYKAGTSLLGPRGKKKIDNHGKPTLVVDGEGYIHLILGGAWWYS